MSIRRFAALILATFLFFSISSAYDSKGRSSKKENACCKPCCVTGKTGTHDKEASNAPECCAKEKKADEGKKEQSTIKKETK